MGKEVLAAGVIGIEKHKFQFYKRKMQILKKELVSSKISSGEKNYKYFIGYLYDDYDGQTKCIC